MILLSGLTIGMIRSMALKERESALQEWKKLLLRFKTEISFSAKSLTDLIEECQEYRFCQYAFEDSFFTQNPIESMKKAGPKILKNSKDNKLYEEFLEELGISNVEGQIEHLQLYMNLVSVNLQEAKEDVTQKSKLYIALGCFGAVTICMLMI